MTRTAQIKKIGQHTYEVQQLQATAAFDLFIDLVKMGGPALAPLMQGVGGAVAKGEAPSFGDVDLSSIDLEKTITTICFNLDKKELQRISKQVLSPVTTIVGQGALVDLYEIHFSQTGVFQLIQWLIFAVMAQFTDFSEASQRTIAGQKRQANAATQNP